MGRISRLSLAVIASAGISHFALAQSRDVSDFSSTIQIVDSLFNIHSGSSGKLNLTKVVRSGRNLNFYFSGSLNDRPLRPEDKEWFRNNLKEHLPEEYSGYKVADIYSDRIKIENLAVSPISDDGCPSKSKFSRKSGRAGRLTDRGIAAPKGLNGRHIAMWQSHGYYFDVRNGEWKWQRPKLFGTVEDLFTQSYVVPFLVPMLENAGANVLLPRERDWHDFEIIADNDDSFTQESGIVCGRIHGRTKAGEAWTVLHGGFADTKPFYDGEDNPFLNGTSLQCKSITGPGAQESAVTWIADIPERGEYAVYVSYVTLSNSCSAARYTIHSIGCDVPVTVNQRMGGGSWVYVGAYEFDSGIHELVSLSNLSSESGVIVADAVKIGGGMGNIGRRSSDSTSFFTSGKPRFSEGARYYMQWSGTPPSVWSQNESKDDYRDDFMSRGRWVKYLSGGSWVNPKADEGLKIPIDLSMAFHTDAGKRDNNGIVGTLAIYTLKSDNSVRMPSGDNRATCRELTDFIQTQVVNDIRSRYDSLWNRRMLWNRSYSESRISGTPAILLELLSHENFEDMKYGLDPMFRFFVSRSCYKGILKYLSMHYGVPYVVQPLPVRSFSAAITPDSGKGHSATLKWKATVDSLERTAVPSSYILYTRIDGNGWDSGHSVSGKGNGEIVETKVKIEPGHIYSYKVVARNEGGLSFPSEILSVGIPTSGCSGACPVTIVNNFNRVSGPVWFEMPGYAGFNYKSDSGVPYVRDWSYIGNQKDFQPCEPYTEKDGIGSGFGVSDDSYADKVIGGNTFDYPFVHGRSILKAGYAFESCSAEAFETDASLRRDKFAIDLICGKECRVKTATRSPARGGVFPKAMRSAIKDAVVNGCNILISGSYIASDATTEIYPLIQCDDIREQSEFIRNTLGYTLHCSFASSSGDVCTLDGSVAVSSFPTSPVRGSYCAESPDALHSFNMGSSIHMTYRDTNLPAAVRIAFKTYKVAAFGFPLEILSNEQSRDVIFAGTMSFFSK